MLAKMPESPANRGSTRERSRVGGVKVGGVGAFLSHGAGAGDRDAAVEGERRAGEARMQLIELRRGGREMEVGGIDVQFASRGAGDDVDQVQIAGQSGMLEAGPGTGDKQRPGRMSMSDREGNGEAEGASDTQCIGHVEIRIESQLPPCGTKLPARSPSVGIETGSRRMPGAGGAAAGERRCFGGNGGTETEVKWRGAEDATGAEKTEEDSLKSVSIASPLMARGAAAGRSSRRSRRSRCPEAARSEATSCLALR